MCISICIHIHIHVYMGLYMFMYIQCVNLCLHMYMYAYIAINVSTGMCMSMHVMCIFVYILHSTYTYNCVWRRILRASMDGQRHVPHVPDTQSPNWRSNLYIWANIKDLRAPRLSDSTAVFDGGLWCFRSQPGVAKPNSPTWAQISLNSDEPPEKEKKTQKMMYFRNSRNYFVVLVLFKGMRHFSMIHWEARLRILASMRWKM